MTIDEAIDNLKAQINALQSQAEVKVTRVSDEEARLNIYVAAASVEPLREALRDPVLQLMVQADLDVQVFVYDRDAPRGVVTN